MKYRIQERQYAVFDGQPFGFTQSVLTTYVVQMRYGFVWLTIKEFDEGADDWFALQQAEELIEKLNEK